MRRRAFASAVALLAVFGCGDDPTGAPPECGDAPLVPTGQLIHETLAPSDERLASAYVDFYTLRLDSAAWVVIEMESAEFSPLVHLFDPDGRPIAQAYDPWGAAEPEAAVLTTLLEPACYTIAPSSWKPGETGAYTLLVTEGPEGADPPAPAG